LARALVRVPLRGRHERHPAGPAGRDRIPCGTTDSASGLQIYQVEQGDARLARFEGALEYHPTSFLHLRGTADYVAGQNTKTAQPLPSIPPFRTTYTVRLEGEGTSAFARPYLSLGGETHARLGIRAAGGGWR
jgi:hypothetical protein